MSLRLHEHLLDLNPEAVCDAIRGNQPSTSLPHVLVIARFIDTVTDKPIEPDFILNAYAEFACMADDSEDEYDF
jgi:hypothetical protein